MFYTEPPTKIYCPPRKKQLPLTVDETAPVRIYTPHSMRG